MNRKRLIAARKAAGLTQVDLAHDVGCTPGTISKMERGLGNPSFELVAKIAKRLGVSTDRLVRGKAVAK